MYLTTVHTSIVNSCSSADVRAGAHPVVVVTYKILLYRLVVLSSKKSMPAITYNSISNLISILTACSAGTDAECWQQKTKLRVYTVRSCRLLLLQDGHLALTSAELQLLTMLVCTVVKYITSAVDSLSTN